MNAILSQNELAKARLFADLSALAYRPQSEIQNTLPALSLTFGDFFNDSATGTQGFLAKSERGAFFLFRGTELDRPEDVIVDLLAWPAAGLNGRIHAGFQSAFDSIRNNIDRHLKQLRDLAIPVYFGGHSLGGALAVLAASHAVDQNIPVSGLYTFGQPRVGDKAFEKYYSSLLGKNYYRFTNAQDLFPHVPPCFLGYRHLGEACYHFNDEGNLERSSSRWEWIIETAYVLAVAYSRSQKIRDFIHKLFKHKPQASETLKPLAKEAFKVFVGIFKSNIVDDHDMKACYIKNLERIQ